MRRRLTLFVLPIAAISGLLAAGGHAVASRAQPFAVIGSFTDKPYTATTPDSGSAGNNWALDLFTRSFAIHPPAIDGTTTVVETFNNGKFISLGDGATGSAQSPGANDPGSGNSTHQLREGVSGTFTGTFTIVVDNGFSYTPNKGCGPLTDNGCASTADWVHQAFGSAATYNVTAYKLVYKSSVTGLLGTTWTNANTGDLGDIYTG